MRMRGKQENGRVRVPGIVVLAVILLALGAAPPAEKEPFPYSTVGEACAPWDGPAIDLHFSTAPLKCGKGDVIELRVSFWRDLPLHDDQTFTVDEKSKWGGASYCKGEEQPCQRASSGTIHIESFTSGKGAKGTYELLFPKFGRVTGSFQAEWCPVRNLCR